jgi:hypothetical protein
MSAIDGAQREQEGHPTVIPNRYEISRYRMGGSAHTVLESGASINYTALPCITGLTKQVTDPKMNPEWLSIDLPVDFTEEQSEEFLRAVAAIALAYKEGTITPEEAGERIFLMANFKKNRSPSI